MKEAFDYCVMHTPFKVISINVDNGGEYLNYHERCKAVPVPYGIEYYSIPYARNDFIYESMLINFMATLNFYSGAR